MVCPQADACTGLSPSGGFLTHVRVSFLLPRAILSRGGSRLPDFYLENRHAKNGALPTSRTMSAQPPDLAARAYSADALRHRIGAGDDDSHFFECGKGGRAGRRIPSNGLGPKPRLEGRRHFFSSTHQVQKRMRGAAMRCDAVRGASVIADREGGSYGERAPATRRGAAVDEGGMRSRWEVLIGCGQDSTVRPN